MLTSANARHDARVADLEKMALQRDRGYLVRLILLLLAAGIAGGFLFAGLTGESFSGCVANVFVGAPPESTAEDDVGPPETKPKQ